MKRTSSGNNGGGGGGTTSAGGTGGTTSGGASYPSSYQSGGGGGIFTSLSSGGNYRPPVHYAADQTQQLEGTTRAYYQADETARNVLQKMSEQRRQLEGAHQDADEMRHLTEAAKRELKELRAKYRKKKQQLFVTIGVLAMTDLFLLFRILQCGGNFFC